MKIFEYVPSTSFLSIKIVNPSTAFINLPSLIKEEKKLIFDSFRNILDLYWNSGDT